MIYCIVLFFPCKKLLPSEIWCHGYFIHFALSDSSTSSCRDPPLLFQYFFCWYSMSAVSVVILGLFNVMGCLEVPMKKTEALVSQENMAEVLVFCFDLCPVSDTCHNNNHSCLFLGRMGKMKHYFVQAAVVVLCSKLLPLQKGSRNCSLNASISQSFKKTVVEKNWNKESTCRDMYSQSLNF